MEKRRLGRGLDALIGSSDTALADLPPPPGSDIVLTTVAF